MELIEQAQQQLSDGRRFLADGDPRRAQQHALAVQGDLIDTLLNAGGAADERASARKVYAEAGELAAEATSQLPTFESRRRSVRSVIANATSAGGVRAVSHGPVASAPAAEPRSVSADHGLN